MKNENTRNMVIFAVCTAVILILSLSSKFTRVMFWKENSCVPDYYWYFWLPCPIALTVNATMVTLIEALGIWLYLVYLEIFRPS